MKLHYRISLWNYFHYAQHGRYALWRSLEEVVNEIYLSGYGVELWPSWGEYPIVERAWGRKKYDLFDEIYRERLRNLLKDKPSSWHSGNIYTFEENRRQIDTASYVGSDVIVVHLRHILTESLDNFALARKVIAYANLKNVKIALENGGPENDASPLPILKNVLDQLDDLKACIDTGHIYHTRGNKPQSMKAYVDVMKDKLCHLHLHDYIEDKERDHFMPGRGLIRKKDWLYLLRALSELDFEGAAVLEIRPSPPLRIAMETEKFFNYLLQKI